MNEKLLHLQECSSDWNSGTLNRMIVYGGMVGGPRFDDTYYDWRGGNWVLAEVTQDYTAAFSTAMARLVMYYDLPPFCDESSLDLGWDHPNAPMYDVLYSFY